MRNFLFASMFGDSKLLLSLAPHVPDLTASAEEHAPIDRGASSRRRRCRPRVRCGCDGYLGAPQIWAPLTNFPVVLQNIAKFLAKCEIQLRENSAEDTDFRQLSAISGNSGKNSWKFQKPRFQLICRKIQKFKNHPQKLSRFVKIYEVLDLKNLKSNRWKSLLIL